MATCLETTGGFLNGGSMNANVMWRLTRALMALEQSKSYYKAYLKTKDKNILTKYIFECHGFSICLALIIDEKLTMDFYIADRILDTFHLLNKYEYSTKPPSLIKVFKIYDALYKATLKFWILELNKIKSKDKSNPEKILNITENENPKGLFTYYKKLYSSNI